MKPKAVEEGDAFFTLPRRWLRGKTGKKEKSELAGSIP